MEERGYTRCCPVRDPSVEELPAIDLTAGYVKRAEGINPSQGSRPPWPFNQGYALDEALLGQPIDDGTLELNTTEEKPAARQLPAQAEASNA